MGTNYALTSLHICTNPLWNQDTLKILKQGETYRFRQVDLDDGDYVDEDFYGHGVTVCAIVGKNGSGKSSVLDIIYRMVNNLGHVMQEAVANRPGVTWERYHHLDYVFRMFCDLHFISNGEKGCLSIRDNIIALRHGRKKWVFKEVPDTMSREMYKGVYPNLGKPSSNEFEDYNLVKVEDLQPIANVLAYVVVTNYAMQSFLSSDYNNDSTLWSRDKGTIKGIRPNYAETWIDAIFHKNDGYQTPITLNPFRSHGEIDMQREKYLTVGRIASILLYYDHLPQKPQLIEGYNLHSLDFNFLSRIAIDKCGQTLLNGMTLPKEDYVPSLLNRLKVVDYFVSLLANKDSVAATIIREYGYEPLIIVKEEERRDAINNPILISQMYLVYKTLITPTKRYPTYEDFDEIGPNDINLFCSGIGRKAGLIKGLVGKLKDDKSHIAQKIRRTRNFLTYLKGKADKDMVNISFDYETYRAILKLGVGDLRSLYDVQETMPPDFFLPEIFLYKPEQKKAKDNAININSLSTGERQKIFTISTMVYHALNILSVRDTERLKYRNLCLVLDEVELCFHPEYQRSFVDSLVRALGRTGVSYLASIQIILSTHSPFILSDIPKSNVLMMEDGIGKYPEKETFCANIHDMLNQSFFMDYSIGDIARNKVEWLFDVCRKVNEKHEKMMLSDNEIHQLEYIASHIGDEYLQRRAEEKVKLLKLYVMDEDELEEHKRSLERELKDINNRLNGNGYEKD